MLQKIRNWRWAIAIGLLLAAALAYSLWPEATPVDLGKVTRGPMAVGVTDDGVTREKELYTVSAPVTGYAERLTLEAGDRVERGQLLTRMRSRLSAPLDRRTQEELRGALGAARASERAASATLEQSQRDLARAEALAKDGFLSRAQLESNRTRVSTGRAQLELARADIRRIEASLGDGGRSGTGAPVDVRAPVSGAVLVVPDKSEGIIAEGTPIATIGDPSKIEIVIDLLSREAVRVKPGDRAEITQWGGPRPLIGHVKYIEPYGRLKISALGIEEQRVNVIIGFDPATASQAARLGHGYQVDATIILWSNDAALRVPVGALFRGQDGAWRVFVNEDGRAHERKVKLGQINDEFAEVLGGLEEGASVVLNPGNALRNRDRIKRR
ncbi:efflux RND transporter periplasmic adaptor subunit [Altererythrobacter fulvus]|uniref:efflux RND transporter periplasmic adaptor subunit n=1 Tax=Caenibius fulvus TaxID=2126012 RepID=UPI003019D5B5